MKPNVNKWLVSSLIILGLLMGAGLMRPHATLGGVSASQSLASDEDPADCPPEPGITCAHIHIPVGRVPTRVILAFGDDYCPSQSLLSA